MTWKHRTRNAAHCGRAGPKTGDGAATAAKACTNTIGATLTHAWHVTWMCPPASWEYRRGCRHVHCQHCGHVMRFWQTSRLPPSFLPSLVAEIRASYGRWEPLTPPSGTLNCASLCSLAQTFGCAEYGCIKRDLR